MSLKIKIDLFGIGTIKGDMMRYYAPLSADAIINKFPLILRGRFSFGSKIYWTLPGVEIYKGSNTKSKKDVEKGDIIYNPKTDELIFILEKTELESKVNIIGKVTENLEFFQQAKNGLNTKISKIKS
ncbi:MAG: hypothetical protein KGD67_01055 [Candidatus Lokiarchaeota archaeon]|nr:hypothetical protein [Candidatus Lokiarchaeota archaeon]